MRREGKRNMRSFVSERKKEVHIAHKAFFMSGPSLNKKVANFMLIIHISYGSLNDYDMRADELKPMNLPYI
ncbi:hypothetical protein NECAME_02431 [Necator americanus]|uniref:Uncharacterized protein n=1 Tax=Necator americanus TaxID=51031 RepID=W2TFE4_NECAM|nr:hypothetical protein NECAME_02431 [Necator americanus]ETN80299.1 hypothetical protein NECAME_02431 [Necator americanus]